MWIVLVASYPVLLKVTGFTVDQISVLLAAVTEFAAHVHLAHAAAGLIASVVAVVLVRRRLQRWS